MWTYFAGLGIGVLMLLWVLQIFFLNNGYERMKIQEVDRVGGLLKSAYKSQDKNLNSSIQELSVINDFYVMMEVKGQILLFAPEQESTLPIYKYKDQLPQLKEAIFKGDPDSPTFFKFSTMYEKYSTLAYALFLDDTKDKEVILYIFSPLYPVTSTVNILKDQLINVTIITLLVTFILAGYLASSISKPIRGITSTAKQMGTGDYNVNFRVDSFTEINNLANTLNMTAYELGMADTRQKDLIANVSHDLKTPLTMIRSYAEMIRDLSGNDPEKREVHLGVIIDESVRMANLVSDMATISAMRTAKMELNKSSFDLSAITASILASYEILEAQEGYQFKFTCPKECFVYADEDRIKQVIANLTGNAIKYGGEDKLVSVNIRRSGKKYRLEVSDNGPGISAEELPHVWDRYYKVSSNYVRPASGTGLGLSIVKEILTLHHARYGVSSKLGKGSTFWFELEMAKPQKA